MRTTALSAVLCALALACAPSRASLFDPVRSAVSQRTGIEPTWRHGRARPAAIERRIVELAAAPLTAESAAQLAVLSSPELQASYEELAASGARYAAASTPANPELEAELRFPVEGDGDVQLELSATQDLSGLLAIIGRSRAASRELAAARREAVARSVDLVARARRAVYRAAAAERRLALRRTVAETAEAAAELSRALHQAGNIRELDLLRESLFAEDARLALRAAEADAGAAREELGAVLGLPADARWRLAEGILDAAPPALDPSDLEREAVAASLELDALRARLDAAGARVGVARLESFLPHLGAGVSATREGEHGWAVGPAVSLSLPLWDWGQGKRAAAWAETRRLGHQLAAAEIEVRAAARTARGRLLAAEDALRRIRENLLPLRALLIDESVKQYNAMSLGPFELLLVKREQIEIEERTIEALRDAWIARTDAWQLRAGSRPAPAAGAAPTTESRRPSRGEEH